MIKRVFILAALTAALFSLSYAVESEVFEAQYNALDLKRLERNIPAAARENMSEIHISERTTFDSGLQSIWGKIRAQFKGVFRKGLKCIVAIIVIAAMCAVATSIGDTTGGAVTACVSAVGAVAMTAAATGSVTSIIGMGSAAISDINMFSKALLPSLAAACAASGMPASATAKYTATMLFIDVIITLISMVLLPLVYAYLAASTADAAIENHSLSKICSCMQWIVTGTLKTLLMVFVAYITISGIVSSSVDVVGVKTARFALSGAVPVVGSVIADAAETVIAGALVMKNALGIYGMLVILSVCVTPFLTMGVNYLLFKAASAVSAPICNAKLARLVDNIGNSFGIVLGMIGSTALLMFLSILFSMYSIGAV